MKQQNSSTPDGTREACALTQPVEQPVDREQRKTTASGAAIGEGSYEGTERYAQSIGNYLEHADVTADAKAAAPKSADEARELRRAEAEAASRGRGEDE